jgi:hypothetical protein
MDFIIAVIKHSVMEKEDRRIRAEMIEERRREKAHRKERNQEVKGEQGAFI